MRRNFLAVLLVVACFPFGAAHAAAGEPDRTITIDNFVFTPKTLTIAAGTKVVWINRDDIPHTVVGNGAQAFNSPPLDTGDKFAMIFDRPGSYRYFCSIHPMMTGTILVK